MKTFQRIVTTERGKKWADALAALLQRDKTYVTERAFGTLYRAALWLQKSGKTPSEIEGELFPKGWDKPEPQPAAKEQ